MRTHLIMLLSRKTYWPFIIALLCLYCPLYAQDVSKNYKEEDLNFVHDGDSIFGKLIIPKQKGKDKLPVIVFVHGSGPEDYSSSDNYNYLWQEFAKIGFASFSWDKPGVGKSEGQWYEQTMTQRATEVIAAINKLNTVGIIDGDKIGLWGISQAGWVMPKVVVKTQIAFVISVSSPVTTAFDQELYRVTSELKGDGFSTSDVDKAISYTKQLKKLIDEDRPYSEFLNLQNQIANFNWAETVIRGDEMIYKYVDVIIQEDHVPSIENYHCPILAVWGKNDLLVPPMESSDFFREKMKEINNPNALVKIIAQADHTLTLNLTGKRSETIERREHYKNNPKEIFALGYISMMTAWLNKLNNK
jgi:uncharacterized protein